MQRDCQTRHKAKESIKGAWRLAAVKGEDGAYDMVSYHHHRIFGDNCDVIMDGSLFAMAKQVIYDA